VLSANSLKQHSIPVEFEESLLPARKPSHVHDINGAYTHPYERRAMGDGRNDEPSIVFETDESTVKEVVNTRRQEQPVLTIQSLFVSRNPAKACNGSRLDEPGSEPRLSDTSIQFGLRGP
jgi:hypothetical protein